MENSNNASMSDKDKQMSESFEFATDDTEESAEKSGKKKKQAPKRSLFLPQQETQQEPKAEADQSWIAQQKDKLLSGTLLERVLGADGDEKAKDSVSEAEAEASSVPESTELSDPSESIEGVDSSEITEEFKDHVADSAAAIQSEIAADGDSEVAESAADFVEAVEVKVDNGAEPERAIEAAQQEIVERVDQPEALAEVVIEAPIEIPLSPDQTVATEVNINAVEESRSPVESEPEQEDRTKSPPTAHSSSAAPQRTQTQRGSGGSGSSNGPLPPSGPPLGPPAGGNSLPPADGPTGPNVITMAQAAPNILSPVSLNSDPSLNKMNDMYYRRKNTGKVVLAGVVGYALGRRRGRIKTENRFEPQIGQKDSEISDLKTKLDTSEQKVRSKTTEAKALREKVSEQSLAEVPATDTVIERAVSQQQAVEAPLSAPSAAVSDKTPIEVPIVEQVAQPQAAELAEIQKQQEAYADQLVNEPQPTIETSISLPESPARSDYGSSAAERLQDTIAQTVEQVHLTPSTPEYNPAKTVAERTPAAERSVAAAERPKGDLDTQAMTMPELLEIADTIDTGSGSLKQMYEQRRIDSVNMRKAIAEHAAGRNIDDLVHKSLEAEEMQRELRNEVKTDSSGDPKKASGSGLGSSGGAAIQAATQDPDSASGQHSEADEALRQYEDNIVARQMQEHRSRRTGVFEHRITDMNPVIASVLGIAAGALIAGLLLFLFA